jgi:hypothetical protein
MHPVFQKIKGLSDSSVLVAFILLAKTGDLAIQIGSVGEEFGECIFSTTVLKELSLIQIANLKNIRSFRPKTFQ